MLPLVARNHVNWLLQQVKIEVLEGSAWRVVKVPINEGLASSIE